MIARVRLARVRGDDGHDAAPAWLGADERVRWATLAPPRRPAFVASRRLLRELLAQATDVPAGLWKVGAAAGAAPVAARLDLPAERAPPVSVAHRLDWVAAAVGGADDGAVGVDIECDRPTRGDPAGRAALVMAGDELAHWSALPEDRREAALLCAWVAREAWFKATGPGAPWDFRRLACEPADAARANVQVWAAGALHVALSADAAAAATCAGWPDPAAPRASLWRVTRR
jgi:phosphopantetheinyl transferase